MKALLALVIVLALTSAPALADSATDVGVLGAVAVGQHVGEGNPVPTNGVVPAALFEFTQHLNSVRLHIDAIPQVSLSGLSTGAYGRSSASASLLDAILMTDFGSHERFRLGAGAQVVNLSNYSGQNGETNSGRASGWLYSAASTLPLRSNHFVELQLYLVPNIRSNLQVFFQGVQQPTEPEQGAEVYYSAAYGWTRGRNTWLLGLSGLSYHTRNTDDGQLVDRNVGGAVTFEWRYRVGARSGR